MNLIKKKFKDNKIENLYSNVIELNSYEAQIKLYKWHNKPILEYGNYNDYRFVEDVNQRRLRDAESVATVVQNLNPKTCLEIGTGSGAITALISINAPNSTIYTVNIPPEEYNDGGTLKTMKLEREDIGSIYKDKKLTNIYQIFENTVKWEPDIGNIDFAFIDGCHDTDFVYNDTKKILQNMEEGSFILWHDFNLDLWSNSPWIMSVCLGIEQLYENEILNNHILHVKDSWVGIYQVKA